jgi:pimeloyl-ACP methyl ester carboxylesterase
MKSALYSKSSKFKTASISVAAVILILFVIFSIFYISFLNYKDPYHKTVENIGFAEKNAQIGEVNFNYAEGPDNGPALLLLHAQHMDWFDYSRVLPALCQSFHIFAVDYHGHGKTTAPAEYYYANQIGGDLAEFIRTVVKEPVLLSGNSSGGILAAWLAANAPDLVRAIILEDPSLLSSEPPRLFETVADKSFAVCYEFIQKGGKKEDFLPYWIDSCRDFFKKYVGFDVAPLLKTSVAQYRKANPGEALEINYLPTTVRMMMRGMNYYDPYFGAAFHDGGWNRDFDHAETLKKIQCPTLLLHANFEVLEDGTFSGALSQYEADKIVSLIPNCEYMRIDSEHVIHLDKPEQYIKIVENFFAAY